MPCLALFILSVCCRHIFVVHVSNSEIAGTMHISILQFDWNYWIAIQKFCTNLQNWHQYMRFFFSHSWHHLSLSGKKIDSHCFYNSHFFTYVWKLEFEITSSFYLSHCKLVSVIYSQKTHMQCFKDIVCFSANANL